MSRIEAILPRDPWNAGLLALLLVAWALSCIALPYPEYFAMQHVPTVLGIIALMVLERRTSISRTSFALIVAFLLLHVVGARYLYSYVPYDDWSYRCFGVRLNSIFGWERNHYDRLVHFAFGLLLTLPVFEVCKNRLRFSLFYSATAAICVILAASAVYEIAEWAIAIVFAPDWAEAYNGQQGDMWDAQKDMALAWAGSILAVLIISASMKRS